MWKVGEEDISEHGQQNIFPNVTAPSLELSKNNSLRNSMIGKGGGRDKLVDG